MPTSIRVLAGAVCGLAFAVAAAADRRPLTPDDLYRLHEVSEPQVSPDGSQVAYTLSTPDRSRDEDASDIWVVSWDGQRNLQLTRSPADEHHPRWSPDGRAIAFLSDRGEPERGEQIWVLELAGGEARRVTHHDGDVLDFAWSPDGARFAYVAQVPRAPRETDKPKPIVIDRLQFKEDETGYLGVTRSHLFLQAASGGEASQLTDGAFNEVLPVWAPDGAALAFFSKRGGDIDSHANWDLFTVEPRVGAAVRQITTNPGTDGDPSEEWGTAPARYSPDGRRIAYLHGGAPEKMWYGIVQIGAIAAAGGDPELPTRTLDRNTVDPRWSHDGKWLYFRIEDDRSLQLARLRLRDGAIERLTAADATVLEYDIGRGGRVVVSTSAIDRPAELAAVERGGLRMLTRHNAQWLTAVELVTARNTAFRSADGFEVHGLVMTPRAPRPPAGYPALLRLHGGPVSQHQHEFDFAWQLFASRGYAVIAPNPRGSTGRGVKYQERLFADWGHVDVPDVLAAVDDAVAAGIADPQRLGIGGWSYGAILTNYVIASDRRFRAATSGAGMSNMLAGFGTDQYVREWEIELGLPWVSPETWTRLSYPFLHADRIVTPTLFMCGEQDFNVPLVGSEQMYQALRRLGVPTELVIYPEQYHRFSRPGFRVDRLQRYLAWYDRFLGPQ